MFGFRRKLPSPAPVGDGRQGWFEGVREGRLCGWAYLPNDPHLTLEVRLSARGDEGLIVRADRYRADLQALGLSECCHGFELPIQAIPGIEFAAHCAWTDWGTPLPGSPWTAPSRGAIRTRRGATRLSLDPSAPGDPRLTGSVYDAKNPCRRIMLAACSGDDVTSTAVASLYRPEVLADANDGFHGFILPLPAPLRTLQHGIAIVDFDRHQILARLGPRSL